MSLRVRIKDRGKAQCQQKGFTWEVMLELREDLANRPATLKHSYANRAKLIEYATIYTL